MNTDEVQDYLEVIKRPMDYSTIALRLELAAYGSESEQSSINGVDANMDPMEVILLNVLCDVDQVHQVRIEFVFASFSIACIFLSHQPLFLHFHRIVLSTISKTRHFIVLALSNIKSGIPILKSTSKSASWDQ